MERNDLTGDIFDQNINEEVSRQSKENHSFLSFSVMPGFKCFFKQSVLRQNLSLSECYQRVMKDHFMLQKMRLPTQKLFAKQSISMSERSKQIYFRSLPSERFYIQSADKTIYRYSFGRDKEEQLSQLQRQVQLYRRSGEQALAKKRKELKEMREEQELIRMKQEQQKARRKSVLQNLNNKASGKSDEK